MNKFHTTALTGVLLGCVASSASATPPADPLLVSSQGAADAQLPTIDGIQTEERLALDKLRGTDSTNETGANIFTRNGTTLSALSEDGSVIVGYNYLHGNSQFPTDKAVMWSLDGRTSAIDLSSIDGVLSSYAAGVSRDGKTIVGSVSKANAAYDPNNFVPGIHAIIDSIFVAAEGETPFEIPKLSNDPLLSNMYLSGISDDGTTVFGQATITDPTSANVMYGGPAINFQAFRWTKEGGTEVLGTLRADNLGRSDIGASSADGTVLVGGSEYLYLIPCACPQASQGNRAFRWENGTMTDLGTLLSGTIFAGDASSRANDVSADGSIVVGHSDFVPAGTTTIDYGNQLRTHAVLWDKSGIRDLGSLSERPYSHAEALIISDDGAIVAGNSPTDQIYTPRGVNPQPQYARHAFRWDETTGMESLGTLRKDNVGDSYLSGMSADGKVIIGNSMTDGYLEIQYPSNSNTNFQTVRRGFVWTDETGMQDIGTLRDKDKLGSSYVDAISADGTVVVGTSDTNETDLVNQGRGSKDLFILRIIRPEDEKATIEIGPMLSLVNTQNQIQQSSQKQAAGLGTLSGNLTGIGDNELEMNTNQGGSNTQVSTQGTAPRVLPFAVSVKASHTRSAAGISQNGATVHAATRVGNLSFGGFLQVGKQTQGSETFDFTSSVPSAGVFIRGGDKFGTGLTWKLSHAQIRGEAQITRDAGFANTEIGIGSADVSASATSAELGFGHSLGKASMNTFARLSHATATRGAFTETAGATFPLSFDELSSEHTMLAIGTSARFTINARNSFTLGATLEKDLVASSNPITGTSAVPGFTNFSVAAPIAVNDVRARINASFSHNLKNGSTITVAAHTGQARFASKLAVGISVGLTARW